MNMIDNIIGNPWIVIGLPLSFLVIALLRLSFSRQADALEGRLLRLFFPTRWFKSFIKERTGLSIKFPGHAKFISATAYHLNPSRLEKLALQNYLNLYNNTGAFVVESVWTHLPYSGGRPDECKLYHLISPKGWRLYKSGEVFQFQSCTSVGVYDQNDHEQMIHNKDGSTNFEDLVSEVLVFVQRWKRVDEFRLETLRNHVVQALEATKGQFNSLTLAALKEQITDPQYGLRSQQWYDDITEHLRKTTIT